jgi:hypothetical protein
VDLAPHPDALHQPPRHLVVGEAAGRDPAQAEVLEADPDQLAHRLGGVAAAAVVGVEHPTQLGLHPLGLLGHVRLGPGVLDGEHQVADDLAVPLDDDRLGQPVRVHELRPVLLERAQRAAQPPRHRLQPTEPPRGLGIVAGRGPQRQPFGAHRPADAVEGTSRGHGVEPRASMGRAGFGGPSRPRPNGRSTRPTRRSSATACPAPGDPTST